MSKKNIFGKISDQTNYDDEIVEYIINSKERGVSDFEIKVSILDLFRNPITEREVIKIWDIYKWWNRLKEISEIQDLQLQRQQERAFVVEDDEDLTQLEKLLQKFNKKGINISVNYDWIPKYESKALAPYLWGNPDNVLVIGDTHEPYSLDWYLAFCREQQEIYDCGTVIHIWDIVDFNSISYHEKIVEELNPAWEFSEARRKLKDWYRTFPNVTVTLWNHDSLPRRQMRTAGLLKQFLKNPNDIFEAPDWRNFVDEITINNVLYTHYGNALVKCVQEWMNMVCWHLHTKAGVLYYRNRQWQIRGLQVGTGIDYSKQVFEYAKMNSKHPVLSCWVVLNSGTLPIVIPFTS